MIHGAFGLLAVLPLLLGDPQTQPSPATKPSHLAFRLVVDGGKQDDPHVEMLQDPFDHERIAVSREEPITGDDVASYTAEVDERRVLLTLTTAGGEKLGKLTRENIDRKLAIVLDGRVVIAPVIRSEVRGAVAISLPPGAPEDEIRALVRRIAAAIPAPATRPIHPPLSR